MLSRKAQLALLDIRHNILLARRFVTDLSFDQFRNSDLHVYAVTRALEIVSEASRRLPDGFRGKHSSLPWKRIMGIGNILRHDYDNVVETVVWSVVHDHLGPLLDVIAAEIDGAN